MTKAVSPWQPINESSPRGRFVLVRWPAKRLGLQYAATTARELSSYETLRIWYDANGQALTQSPTDWMELPP